MFQIPLCCLLALFFKKLEKCHVNHCREHCIACLKKKVDSLIVHSFLCHQHWINHYNIQTKRKLSAVLMLSPTLKRESLFYEEHMLREENSIWNYTKMCVLAFRKKAGKSLILLQKKAVSKCGFINENLQPSS